MVVTGSSSSCSNGSDWLWFNKLVEGKIASQINQIIITRKEHFLIKIWCGARLCHALNFNISVFFIFWLGQGVTRVGMLVFVLSRGFVGLGIYMSMVA